MEKTCKNCGTPITKEYCEDNYPEVCEHWTPKKPMTNADRIRAWNDHELAETIANFVSEIDNGDVRYSDDPNDWLKWLQQPAEEG